MPASQDPPAAADRPGVPSSGNPGAGTRAPRLLANWLSLIGLVLLVGGLSSFVFFFVLDVIPGEARAYPAMNLVPSFSVFLLGGLLAIAGVLREARRRRRGRGPSLERTISFDLRQLRGRLGVVLVAGTAVVTIAMMSFGFAFSELYGFTESNVFCGEACHSVMHPEWITFKESPHARLHCVDCHVGPKVPSYTATKLSGLRQVIALARESYEKPIPTPIHNLRPAREICEQCHWSDVFVGYRELTRTYFKADEENTPQKLRMLVKIGGGSSTFTEGVGIHYHMVVAGKVEYIARDPQRQEIPWVRVTHADGTVTEYDDTDEPLTDEERAASKVFRMDCLDCHNRPAHQFKSPVDAVNAALERGTISRALPFIKVEGVKALDAGYASQEEALAGIARHLRSFYEEEHPEVFENGADFRHAVQALRGIYKKTIFPEMKAQWSAHPDNIGHRDSPGCFRCHNDRMESEDGDALFEECNVCHVILAQGQDVNHLATNVDKGEAFYHPDDEDYLEEYTDCIDCHTGGADVYE